MQSYTVTSSHWNCETLVRKRTTPWQVLSDYCLDKLTGASRYRQHELLLKASHRLYTSVCDRPSLPCHTCCSDDLFCGTKQPMGPVLPWVSVFLITLAKAVILLNRVGASASSWNVKLCKMHTQFSTDCVSVGRQIHNIRVHVRLRFVTWLDASWQVHRAK